MTNKVREALKHVNSILPDVTHVFYSDAGVWFYTDDAFTNFDFAPVIDMIDLDLLEEAVDSLHETWGYAPAAFCLE